MGKEKKTKRKSEKVLRFFIIITVASAILLSALMSYQSRQYLIYSENLDQVAVTVDDIQDLTLEDLAFYVIYEENAIEQKALIYDSENSMSFWNIHTNKVFVKVEAQKTAMNMAVHDYLFYDEALKCGLVLSEEEKELLENRRTDFWEDLYDVQKENLPVSYETLNDSMRKIALAEKYQLKLAEENGTTYAAYAYDGYDYKQWLNEHDISVKVNKKVWNRINFGNITLVHKKQVTIDGEE
ncbi:MAG: hypothetical protein K5675_01255 [Lachnospiraceae bacterium]|nr:hypothetical protein [Lachnospiraceae bacterium]